MNKFETNLNYYIELFDIEKNLFDNGIKWLEKGFLNKSEFLQICLWKSRRPKKLYNQNSEDFIKDVTTKAFFEKDELKKIEILIQLKGVSIPTASAILSVTNPKDYPIIDVRCVETLKDINLISWNTINSINWIDYLNIIREISKKYKKTAREIEKGLFAYNRIKLDENLKNLYK